MVVSIPEGVYTMKDKSRIIKHNQELYQKASKKVKSRILEELSELLHMSREYLGSLLRKAGKGVVKAGQDGGSGRSIA